MTNLDSFVTYVHNASLRMTPVIVMATNHVVAENCNSTAYLVSCHQAGDFKWRGYSNVDWGGDSNESRSTS